MNQEESDQDVADEVSEEVDSRCKGCVTKRTTGKILRRSELVDEQECL